MNVVIGHAIDNGQVNVETRPFPKLRLYLNMSARFCRNSVTCAESQPSAFADHQRS